MCGHQLKVVTRNQPVGSPHVAARRGQTGRQPEDLQELATADPATIGDVVTSLVGDVPERKSQSTAIAVIAAMK
jgi:hypothetical protein